MYIIGRFNWNKRTGLETHQQLTPVYQDENNENISLTPESK
jgi:hypothetical protein